MSVLPMIVSSQLGKEVECKSHLDCFTLLAMTNLTVSNRGGEVGSGVAAPYLPPSLFYRHVIASAAKQSSIKTKFDMKKNGYVYILTNISNTVLYTRVTSDLTEKNSETQIRFLQ